MENDNAGWGAIVVDSRGVIQDTISDYATSVSQSRAEIMAVCQVLTLLAKNAKAIVVSQPNYLSDIHKYWRIRAMAKRRWHMDSGELVPDSDLLHNLLVLENARRISWQKIWRSEQRFYTQTQQLAATVFQTKGV
jgi:ribonuclease HI